ncbi:MAG: hypothetical protein AABX02_04615 [archaeon]
MVYRVISTQEFDHQLEELNTVDQERINRFVEQIHQNPLVGKPLGFLFLREKKFEGRRMYFLIYDEWHVVLLILLSSKKEQSAAIDWIKKNIPALKEYVRRQLESNDITYR